MRKNKGLLSFTILIIVFAFTSIACGASSISNLFATDTPTPTLTFTPTPTFTPSPTLTPTNTPTLTPTPLPTGVTTEEQSDGSTLFIDYDNKYQLVLPANWSAIPLSAKDLADIIKNMAEKNPDLKNIAEAFKKLDPNVIRVIALNQDSKYIVKGFATNLTVTAIEDKIMSSMPVDFVTGAIEEQLHQNGAKILSNHELAKNNLNGVEVGSFDFQQLAPTATGAKIQVRSKALVFQTNGKLIMIQLATLQQFAAELSPILDKIVDSIKFIKP